MAHIYVYSPSGLVLDHSAFARAIKRLRHSGHEVEIDPDALARHERFAGDDATRLRAIARAAASRAQVALPTRGGYGLTRILPGIDYRAIGRAIEGGTRFMGLSDLSALQNALLAQCAAGAQSTSWAGALLLADWGQEQGVDEITQACFDDLLAGRSQGAGWRSSKRDEADAVLCTLEQPIEHATLWGGNLCVLCSMLGTAYFPRIEGGILFLEDVAEHPYRIERMFTQLLHAGVIDAQRAVLLGAFTQYRLGKADNGYSLQSAVQWLRAHTRVPILCGLPHGHIATKVLLPVGAKVSLHAPDRDRLLLWDDGVC